MYHIREGFWIYCSVIVNDMNQMFSKSYVTPSALCSCCYRFEQGFKLFKTNPSILLSCLFLSWNVNTLPVIQIWMLGLSLFCRAPESQINLGVWLPTDSELERWNSPGLLENCGQLGFQGRWVLLTLRYCSLLVRSIRIDDDCSLIAITCRIWLGVVKSPESTTRSSRTANTIYICCGHSHCTQYWCRRNLILDLESGLGTLTLSTAQ